MADAEQHRGPQVEAPRGSHRQVQRAELDHDAGGEHRDRADEEENRGEEVGRSRQTRQRLRRLWRGLMAREQRAAV